MIEYIHDDYNLDGSEGLLAIIIYHNWKQGSANERIKFLTDKTAALQMASIAYKKGDTVTPHIHYRRQRTVSHTQEVLIIKEGMIELSIFNSCGHLVRSRTLVEKDVILLLSGGHGLKALSHTEIIEVKNGPYTTREEDKLEFPTP